MKLTTALLLLPIALALLAPSRAQAAPDKQFDNDVAVGQPGASDGVLANGGPRGARVKFTQTSERFDRDTPPPPPRREERSESAGSTAAGLALGAGAGLLAAVLGAPLLPAVLIGGGVGALTTGHKSLGLGLGVAGGGMLAGFALGGPVGAVIGGLVGGGVGYLAGKAF